MPRVIAVLRTQKLNRQGKAPIYLRVADAERTLFRALGVLVRPSEWNERQGRVRKGHPKADEINTLIQTRIAEAEGQALKFKTAGEAPTAHALREAITPEARSSDFIPYALRIADEHERRGSILRGQKVRAVTRKLQKMLADEGAPAALPFDRITPALLRRFETYLLTKVGNSSNTTRDGLNVIRAVLYRAIREGHAEQAKNPFFVFKTAKEQRPARAKLTADELRKIEALKLEPGSLLWRTRAYFLFCFYCAGIRFGDLMYLKREHVTEEPDGGLRLTYRMRKTSGIKSVRLLPQARAILDAFPPRDGSDFLFPILDGYDLSTPKKARSAGSAQTALANKYLKKIAEAAGVKTKLSTHIARHSFADIARTRGWDVYSISKALGHASIKVTENYLRGFDTAALDEKMNDLFG